MLHPHRSLFLVTAVTLLCACAGPRQRNAPTSDIYGPGNAGLVVGHLRNEGLLGTGLSFKNSSTDQRFGYTGARDFSMWLPEGIYELSSVGSRAGTLGPFQTPLSFSVRKGAIAYVGTVSIGCLPPSPAVKWYGLLNCGLLALGTCTVPSAQVPMCVLDEKAQTIKVFFETYPSLATMPVDSALMQ